MAESLRLRVTVVVDRTLLLLGSVVPGQLQQAFPLRDTVLSTLLDLGVGSGVSQEVQVELVVRVLDGADQGHAHLLLVELQAGLRILDTQHGVVQTVGAGVGGGRQILVGASDDLHPVSVGILGEGNMAHATLGQFLLEGIAGIFNALAGSFDVVDGDGEMTKAPVWLGITINDAVVGIVLSAIVVSELHDGVAVSPVAITLERGRAVVGEKVVGKFPLGEVQFVDQVKAEELIKLHRSLGVLDPHHRIWPWC